MHVPDVPSILALDSQRPVSASSYLKKKGSEQEMIAAHPAMMIKRGQFLLFMKLHICIIFFIAPSWNT